MRPALDLRRCWARLESLFKPTGNSGVEINSRYQIAADANRPVDRLDKPVIERAKTQLLKWGRLKEGHSRTVPRKCDI